MGKIGRYDKDTSAALRARDAAKVATRYAIGQREEARKAGDAGRQVDNDTAAFNQYERQSAATDQIRKLNPDLTERGVQQTIQTARPPSYRKGGVMRKTGVARLHKGERAAGTRSKSCRR